MVAFGQLVIGAAGAGKSSYCAANQRASQDEGDSKLIRVINLDPGVTGELQCESCWAGSSTVFVNFIEKISIRIKLLGPIYKSKGSKFSMQTVHFQN